jgi:hypothetical protein
MQEKTMAFGRGASASRHDVILGEGGLPIGHRIGNQNVEYTKPPAPKLFRDWRMISWLNQQA